MLRIFLPELSTIIITIQRILRHCIYFVFKMYVFDSIKMVLKKSLFYVCFRGGTICNPRDII